MYHSLLQPIRSTNGSKAGATATSIDFGAGTRNNWNPASTGESMQSKGARPHQRHLGGSVHLKGRLNQSQGMMSINQVTL